jgi:hypothetical protein
MTIYPMGMNVYHRDRERFVNLQAKANQDYVGTPEPDMIDVTPPETKEVKFIGSDKKWGKQ